MKKVVEIKELKKSFTILTNFGKSVRSIFLNPFKRPESHKLEVLKGVEFDIKQGEFVGLIGRNGSGKSTLLKVISGIYNADSGDINVNGRLVPFLELGVGFHPDLRAIDNVFLNGTILGMSREHIKERYDKIIEFSELKEFMNEPLKHFSSGMQVRLAFAVGIQSDADIFIWDEVLAVGDVDFQNKAQAKFTELKKKGTSVLLVSHDMDEILEFCDRVIWLEEGRVKMMGDPHEVVTAYSESFE